MAHAHGGVDPGEERIRVRLGDLVQRAQQSTPDHLAELVAEQATAVGLADAVVYLADYGQTRLVPLRYRWMPERSPLSVEGTLAGRAYRTAELVESRADGPEADDAEAGGAGAGGAGAGGAGAGGAGAGAEAGGAAGRRLWLPLLEGSERIGVLEVTVPATATSPGLREACQQFARVIATLLIGRWPYGDVFEQVRRERPMRLPAEIQWRLLPPTTFATDRLVVTGLLEPWDEVAGDAFDYAVNGDRVHLAVFDAMGHRLNATLLATVAIGVYRNARRTGLGLPDTYTAIDREIAEQFGGRYFVTGLLLELDSRTGSLRWISAGHLPPLLLRAGRLVKTLAARPATPMGLMLLGRQPEVHGEQLEPGDRLILYTDGVVEARYHGRFFTEERLADFIVRESASGHRPPEVLRRLIRAVLDHQHGRLQDDATILFLHWGTAGQAGPGTSAY
jgi:Stage II sporulation protein E (SpoIIE)